MPLPRKRQISLVDTPYYHCVSRCVRRAFLCGEDKLTGQSFEHRRQWVEDRLLRLARVFTIDVCAYAVMSNHTHVVLHIDSDAAKALSDIEVARRWQWIHQIPIIVQQFIDTQQMPRCQIQRSTLKETLSVYRHRLCDISWFMRELNEHIARQANKEDDCTGHFWEGRFKSQALLDEQALAACMVYVDLNPIRANIALTPQSSHHTSIKRRIENAREGYQPSNLQPFENNAAPHFCKHLPFKLDDYLALIDTTYRNTTKTQTTGIIATDNPILSRLVLNTPHWEALTHGFEDIFSVAAGTITSLEQFKANTQRKRITPTQLRL